MTAPGAPVGLRHDRDDVMALGDAFERRDGERARPEDDEPQLATGSASSA
jgi:hypothetical protein